MTRASSLAEVTAAAWATVTPPDVPFLDHEFLIALERSGSVGERTGWIPDYLLCWQGETLVGAFVQYLRTNSYGEYIFDWDWARAYQRAGRSYYPKLATAVPFTPATAPKLLVKSDVSRDEVVKALLGTWDDVAREMGASSQHALFITEQETADFASRGFVVRHASQFHWRNNDYRTFDDFLGAMTGKRRRQVERERRQVQELPFSIRTLTGTELDESHARAMYAFYLGTLDRKSGIPYLTEAFFVEVFRTMADRILLAVASDDAGVHALALNFFKGKHLYGRYWGADADYRNLHFELCYYQTIDFAIARGMSLFEAGAQGEHKLARGFLPTLCYSAHKLQDPVFHAGVARYVDEEKSLLAEMHAGYAEHNPFSPRPG